MADFGDIQSNLVLGAGQSVRRNAGDSAFEAYTPGTGTGGGAPQVYNEIHSGTGGTLYYLANVASAATVRAYVNGIRQPVEDSVTASDEVTFSTAPDLGDTLIFDYELETV